ncbi:MAG: Aldehyde dehydrogenase, thermostable [Candidatus Moanabacter tarae]|uniref:Aldehyde dehydrogenase, thermostable n=1 Tax=Candidatus Moanibacter tarae TaxID=2200854 RepID=A0A2Z4AHP2_9BACT|nr:MAG: Aldehyde dehydrogenase, thermostable [Candidatus Moanabacter tarae]|tara:strand:- start:3757 stop:5205 length:1449 start_codon:yes stop_codon:yes gene_type:complete
MQYQNYINGEFVGSSDGQTFEQRDPANLQNVTGEWPKSTREDARNAIEAAHKAFPSWADLGVYQRAEIMSKAVAAMKSRTEEIVAALNEENGKTLEEARTEVSSAIRESEFQISQGLSMCGETAPSAQKGVFAYSVRRPVGVSAIISPWNFPFNVPGRKCTPALISGNTIVFKPASLTPKVGRLFLDLYIEAGLPPGVLNFVTGGGSTVGEEMITNPLVETISFTGSTDVGKGIQQSVAQNLKRTQLELGGKNPAIVLEDADLGKSVEAVATAAFACAGQWCTSTSRAIVVRSVADAFTEKLLERVGSMRVGDGRSADVDMGPVCGTDQLETILNYIDIGKKEGANLIQGGLRMMENGLNQGCFIEPTVFTDVQSEMRIAQEEIFGPVLSVMIAEDFEEALELANNIEFGLTSSIFTQDISRAFQFLDKTEVGLTHVNMMTAYREPQLSFGGVKSSGHGIPESGRTGIEFFTEHKVAFINYM